MPTVLFLTSFAAISLQVAWMHVLNSIYYGTFTPIMIGIALLGFGAGGTFLAVARKRIRGRERSWSAVFAAAAAIGAAAGTHALARIPLNLAYMPYAPGEILKLFLVMLALVPAFFGCGALIGLILVEERRKRGLYYGINLVGSGLGGLGVLAGMSFLSPMGLPLLGVIPMTVALGILGFRLKDASRAAATALAAFLLAAAAWIPPDRVDQYKDSAAMKRLEAQREARFLGSLDSPHGRLEAYAAPSFHHILFAGLNADAEPPEQIAVYRSGNLIGAPFAGTEPSDGKSGGSDILDRSLPSLAYELTGPRRVLVVGDASLTAVRTALRAGAEEVILLLPDRYLEEFLRTNLASTTSNVFARPEIAVRTGDFRRYLAGRPGTFDVIHLAAAETLAAPTSGYAAAEDDYLLTVEALTAAIGTLAPGGVLTVSRGMQIPPRDNAKLLLALGEALGESGAPNPYDHLLQARDYLAVNTMAFRNPADANLSARFRGICRDWTLDIEYEPGAGEAPPGHYSFSVPGPEGSGDSWYRHAARRAADGRAADLIEGWVFDIRPATDDRPFFHSYFRWKNLDRLTELYGRYWFRQSDLGSLVIAVSLALAALLAFLLVLLPHLAGGARLRTGFLAYFPCIGAGYLILETVLIRRSALYLGNPGESVPLVLAAVLVSSGLGSAVQERVGMELRRKASIALPALAVGTAAFVLPTGTILSAVAALDRLGPALSYCLVVLMTGVPAFFMGWFFAPGLSRLQSIDPEAPPAAWALNGFASVLASPAAILAAMRIGYAGTALIGIGFYAAAVLMTPRPFPPNSGTAGKAPSEPDRVNEGFE